MESVELNWVIFVDMDTLPSMTSLAPHDYLKLSPSANLIGGSNPSLPILLNSGLLFVRNTHWSRSFLKRWWALRCGFKDQLSLWKALFEAWGKETSFSYPDHALTTYATARHYALPLVIENLPLLLEPATRWACGGDCAAALKHTGCQLEPLRLRHVLLLPVVPFVDARTAVKVPPSISRDGAGDWKDDYWICHAACVFETPRKPNKIVEHQCRNDSTFHVFNCQCGDVAHARQP